MRVRMDDGERIAAEAAAQSPDQVDGAEGHQQYVGEALQRAADQMDRAEAGEERGDAEQAGGRVSERSRRG